MPGLPKCPHSGNRRRKQGIKINIWMRNDREAEEWNKTEKKKLLKTQKKCATTMLPCHAANIMYLSVIKCVWVLVRRK